MTEERQTQLADIVYDIIGAAMEVHSEYGFGISEGVYEEALCIELGDYGYEKLKAVETILPEHRAQLYNYLRLTKKPIGILLNFGRSLRAEKYIYDPETNEIDFFNVKSSRQQYDFDE